MTNNNSKPAGVPTPSVPMNNSTLPEEETAKVNDTYVDGDEPGHEATLAGEPDQGANEESSIKDVADFSTDERSVMSNPSSWTISASELEGKALCSHVILGGNNFVCTPKELSKFIKAC